MTDENQIYVIVETLEPEETTVVEGTRSGREDTGPGWDAAEIVRTIQQRRVAINASKLKAEMKKLIAVVDDVFEQAEPAQAKTGLKLEEVTLSVTVNAEGQLSILGTGGKLGASSGITLKFAR
ncbi:hypothetical protein [cf. Phormidesmis sp. LEGE 11477]|uniref:Pepco domain-containing protein n=1 Tax=cf. Phormidesmis sp. LEGE 11477 TaxID=1828680 RepID=UPI00187F407F|nr:hypothetical protein [cf. Phormidesmis sp. LEGE 11477]MBE9059762.1 hypothetical protein [cf. Phormidesmis sp. LEGE 11477]